MDCPFLRGFHVSTPYRIITLTSELLSSSSTEPGCDRLSQGGSKSAEGEADGRGKGLLARPGN
jgi:hypothetical protein